MNNLLKKLENLKELVAPNRNKAFVAQILRAKTAQTLTCTISSNSMKPTLNKGDVVTVASCKAEQLKVNDIAVFTRYNKLIAHRIVKIEEIQGRLNLIEKGDNLTKGRKLNPKAILGKIVGVN